MTPQQAVAATLDDLPPEVVTSLREASARIKVRMSRTVSDIVEIGRDLVIVKKALGHGRFLPWIEAEFGMHENTALNFMRVAKTFGSKSTTIVDLPPTVLYALAAPSTPEPVREEVIQKAAKGEKVTSKTVEKLKEKLKAAERQAKEERDTRTLYESRAREVMTERDQANATNKFLQSQVEQLQSRLTGDPPSPEPEVIPPPEVDPPELVALRRAWLNADQNTKRAFFLEITL